MITCSFSRGIVLILFLDRQPGKWRTDHVRIQRDSLYPHPFQRCIQITHVAFYLSKEMGDGVRTKIELDTRVRWKSFFIFVLTILLAVQYGSKDGRLKMKNAVDVRGM